MEKRKKKTIREQKMRARGDAAYNSDYAQKKRELG